jgi:Bacterial extracellular solute-binding protein
MSTSPLRLMMHMRRRRAGRLSPGSHRARFLDRDGHLTRPGMVEGERQRKGLSLTERLGKAQQHDVHPPRAQRDGVPGWDVYCGERSHLHDPSLHRHRVQLGPWEVFRRAEAVRPGSREQLEAKAIKLTGGPAMPQPPPDRNVYAWHVAENRADLFLGYCTNSKAFKSELADGRIVELPPELAVGAKYGLTVLETAAAPRAAAALALYILSNDGQRVLHEHGFDAPLLNED